MKQNAFNEFTNLYDLSKTLRFELIPIGKTLENIQKQEGILQDDELRQNNYKKIKPIIDELHNDFINESLSSSKIEWGDFFDFYEAYKHKLQNKANISESDLTSIGEEFQSEIDKLRKGIENLFIQMANIWKKRYGDKILKSSGYKILTEKGILKVLEKKYKDDIEKLDVIKSFDGFFTYFTGFNQNRENYYTNKGKSTEIITRTVDQNLIKFFDNILLKSKVLEIGLTELEMSIFNPNYYNKCLTQEGIDSYNEILGGKMNDNGVRISDGLNQRINQFNQKNKTKIPQLKILYKQIGSVINKTIPFEIIQDDKSLKEIITEFVSLSNQYNPEIQRLIKLVFENEDNYDKIWISKNTLSWISNKFFISWGKINEIGINHKIFKNEKDKNTGEEKVKLPEYVNMNELKKILESLEYIDQEGIDDDKKEYIFKKDYENKRNGENNNWKLFCKIFKEYSNELIIEEEKSRIILKSLLNDFDKSNNEHKTLLKAFADKNIEILRLLRIFKADEGKLKGLEKSFIYNDIDRIFIDYSIVNLYDQIRNYITKKPFSEEKMKLNFNCSTLLAGWDKNKESDNLSVILKDNNNYYLAILNKSNNKYFDKTKNPKLYNQKDNNEILEKMNYKLVPGPNKMLPKCLLPGKDKKKYGATDEILSIYEKGSFKKGKDFDKNSLESMIEFYKKGLRLYEDWQVFNFTFKNTNEYEDISQFYFDVERQGYKISWDNIDKTMIMDSVEKGEIYLFNISSKDFKKLNKSSKQDLQTIYWNSIFDLKSNTKLNGQAEVFFRKQSIKDKIIKKLNIENPSVIEHKRYTEDKILFHCPITLNFGTRKDQKINDKVNNYLKQSDQFHIIGIDRGEKHLAFYSVINTKGEIVEQGTLNIINGVDYEYLLSEKAKNRDEARKNWETIGKIKELKEGYISQVIRKIADLVLKYNAIVVLENLNSGFKNSRKKIEQSIYQNLELALAKKFSFLVNKDVTIGEPGSATNAFQLCPVVNNFGEIEKASQWGIMFYTRANYTSITDPISGFRKNIYLKKGDLEEMKKQIFSFKDIGFDYEKNAYYFVYNPEKFKGSKSSSKEWKIWSNVERFRGKQDNHGIWKSQKYDPTEELNKLFNKYGIEKNEYIIDQIKDKDFNKSFFQSLIWIIDLILQIRNTDDSGIDFIHSPVDVNGIQFNSKEYLKFAINEETNSIKYPTSGDSNGAYNIARKGLMMINNIKNNIMSVKNKNYYKLYISDEEWDKFVIK